MHKLAGAALAILAVTGCVRYTKPLPAVGGGPAPAPAAPPRKPLENARRVALTTLVVDVPVGHVYGENGYGYSGCTDFEKGINTKGRVDLALRVYADVFNGAMSRWGYPVDDGLEMFPDSKDHVADLQVGARIVDLTINQCYPDLGRNRNFVRGNAFLRVQWSVFSNLEKKILLTTTTEGTTYREIQSDVGEQGLIRAALGDAAERLAASAAYRQLVEAPARGEAPKEARVKLRRVPALTATLQANLETVRKAVATVHTNKGTGSGFVVSSDGNLVTAAHVVSGSRFVKAKLAGGKECYGEVAAASKERDLALVRLECQGLTPLPLLTDALVEGRDVYAVGTPLGDELSFSVTKGVVSGLRKLERLDYIQSDVKVLPGNSGGPLLDAAGNAVGVAVLGVAFGAVPVGMNFFIPVADIPKYLPVAFE